VIDASVHHEPIAEEHVRGWSMRPSKVVIGPGFWLQIARGLARVVLRELLAAQLPRFQPDQPGASQISATAQTTDSLLGLSVALSQRQATKISQWPQFGLKSGTLLTTVARHSSKGNPTRRSIELGKATMTSTSFTAVNIKILELNQHPASATTWHQWTVIIPRRTITGRLVHGKVWRRHDGRRWLYKKFIEEKAS
jgi:hypothetical protein